MFEALSPQQKADVLEYLLTPDLVGLFEVSRISLHANLSPSHAFSPSTLGKAKAAKTRHRQRVGGRHRRLAVFDGETDMDVLHVQTLIHPEPEEIYFEFTLQNRPLPIIS